MQQKTITNGSRGGPVEQLEPEYECVVIRMNTNAWLGFNTRV